MPPARCTHINSDVLVHQVMKRPLTTSVRASRNFPSFCINICSMYWAVSYACRKPQSVAWASQSTTRRQKSAPPLPGEKKKLRTAIRLVRFGVLSGIVTSLLRAHSCALLHGLPLQRRRCSWGSQHHNTGLSIMPRATTETQLYTGQQLGTKAAGFQRVHARINN